MTEAAHQPTPRERAEAYLDDHAAKLAKRSKSIRLNDEARKVAANMARTDPEAWREFTDEVVSEVVITRLRSHFARIRTAAVRNERLTRRRGTLTALHRDTTTAVERGEAPPSPLDAKYATGSGWKRLGSLKRPELLALAHHRSSLARANGIEAVFLAALAERLPDDNTTVEEIVTADDITNLHEKATGTPLADLPTTTDNDKDNA